ncbi:MULTISPECIES: SLATT domain-containing protein [unclassified Gemella]|uniref:SLATT domain-containing protein n=1 Tax=unclassified Gemella TaxID=2624949 RepID=UPI001C03F4B6|nr:MULTISPECIES: SLATT domain-containing protein [unclassified Gemella]MBU0279139.1 SLATT domain-containing protein [Gemella sp. zg-1178]QWQ38616.1 SLATT domain-containing protein [Gemella sp. zg-570]
MNDYFILEDNVRNTFMSVVWAHKIQEKQADILSNKYKRYEVARIICSSLTSAGLISLIFVDEFWVKLGSALLSFLSAFISMFFKSFELQNNIQNHKKTAVELLILRDKFKVLLIEIMHANNNIEELLIKYTDLQNLLWDVYKNAPNTTDKAVKMAHEALNVKKDNNFTEDKIDINLPKSLQRGRLKNDESKKI